MRHIGSYRVANTAADRLVAAGPQLCAREQSGSSMLPTEQLEDRLRRSD